MKNENERHREENDMNFREMRRSRQLLDKAMCDEILERNTSGVLALLGDGGYPYAVPMSYTWTNGKLYFHCAKTGHKIDAVRFCDKASFCVIDSDEVVPEKYTTHYRSVIVFGKIHVLEDDGDRRAALEELGRKYHPTGTPEELRAEIDSGFSAVMLLELAPEHISGKESIELVNQRTQEK